MPENGKSQNDNTLTQHMVGAISKWLFLNDYAEFKIINDDYSNLVYNCIFQNPKRIEIANGLYGFEIKGVCDGPWGIRRHTITQVVNGSKTFNIKNLGYLSDYIYPEIEFTTTLSTMSIKITLKKIVGGLLITKIITIKQSKVIILQVKQA